MHLPGPADRDRQGAIAAWLTASSGAIAAQEFAALRGRELALLRTVFEQVQQALDGRLVATLGGQMQVARSVRVCGPQEQAMNGMSGMSGMSGITLDLGREFR